MKTREVSMGEVPSQEAVLACVREYLVELEEKLALMRADRDGALARLSRLRPVVGAALDIEGEGPRSELDGSSATGIEWFDEMVDALVSELDALTPEDREWAEGEET